MNLALRPGQLSVPPDGRQSDAALAVCTGARRLLAGLGYASVTELTLASGRRADIIALGPDGCVWIVEVKSSLADFRADGKWPEYRDLCDRFFFAVSGTFPCRVLPDEAGLIVADGYGAAMVREAPEHRMAGARRKAVTLRFAHAAANRHHMLVDPAGAAGWMD
ncbi:MmcB family DNA repair protein [Enterovirga aerilata]|uniref:MmcB family DNA repair protein n=1 Tax=Enterovirga aerilata TaxID=2730920 RepID=A0A849HUP0_9HYPH|nr:MmcB family DNA repair protein [Enterovirga sp. DB1703]NNM70822.1 MmcB family DNA repair protein [Enterovirga sp. DB1703]